MAQYLSLIFPQIFIIKLIRCQIIEDSEVVDQYYTVTPSKAVHHTDGSRYPGVSPGFRIEACPVLDTGYGMVNGWLNELRNIAEPSSSIILRTQPGRGMAVAIERA